MPQNPLFNDLYIHGFAKIFDPLIAADISPLLIEADLSEARVQELILIFQDHVEWQADLVGWVKTLRKSDVAPPLEEAVRIVTQRVTRDWLIARKLSAVLGTKELHFDLTTHRFAEEPAKLLYFATQASQMLGEESRYRNATYSSGFMLDYLSHLGRTAPFRDLVGKTDDWLREEFQLTVKVVKEAIVRGRGEKNLSLEKWTPAVSILQLAGKCALNLLNPTYREVSKKLEKQGLSLARVLWVERKLFGASRADFAQIFALSIPEVAALSKVFILLHEPERAALSSPNSRAQATIQAQAFEVGGQKK